MHRYSSSFLLQLSLIIIINGLSHPTTLNPALLSSQFQDMGLKRKLLLRVIWFVSAKQEVLRPFNKTIYGFFQ